MPQPIDRWIVTPHAALEMARRRISEAMLRRVLTRPEQRFVVRAGRDVLQSRITLAGRRYLVRVFVDVDREPSEVVTVYKTSQISKYWRGIL